MADWREFDHDKERAAGAVLWSWTPGDSSAELVIFMDDGWYYPWGGECMYASHCRDVDRPSIPSE